MNFFRLRRVRSELAIASERATAPGRVGCSASVLSKGLSCSSSMAALTTPPLRARSKSVSHVSEGL